MDASRELSVCMGRGRVAVHHRFMEKEDVSVLSKGTSLDHEENRRIMSTLARHEDWKAHAPINMEKETI